MLHLAWDGESGATLDTWRKYLDMDTDYASLRARIPHTDRALYQAAGAEKGVRILRQDPWEMLISFIISQNRNIPAICRSIRLLCEAAGEKRTDCLGEAYQVFPTPENVCALREEDLKACALGYRWKYVQEAARQVHEGALDLEKLAGKDLQETEKVLEGIYGVGPKVASCIALFGFHQLDAFPRDVWMNRVLKEHYPLGYPAEAYSPYNGVYQQYLFAYARKSQEKAQGDEQAF